MKKMNEDNLITNFLTSYNTELLSKVNRLDEIIGRSHWLSVGNYKESILRKLLFDILPKKYEISTGFIISNNKNNQLIKSKQTDILIWDSTNYAPIFRDNEFVIIPPEACKVMIEVKGVLNKENLKKSFNNYDSMIRFSEVPFSFNFNIKKYIFAYDIDKKIKFPDKIFDYISNIYSNNSSISLENRISKIAKTWPRDNSPWPLFSIDGIFILNYGAILKEIRGFNNNSIRLLLTSFENINRNVDHIYSFFEYMIQSSLGKYSDGKNGLWYADQPGLYSIKQNLNISKTKPKSLMIFPFISKEQLYKNIDLNTVYGI